MVHDLAEYLRGWIGYFGRCETPSVLAELAQWSDVDFGRWSGNSGNQSSASAASLRRKPHQPPAAPMDRGTSLNTPTLKLALSNAYFASPGLREITAPG
jgi:Group II intron, maturase-specific domain